MPIHFMAVQTLGVISVNIWSILISLLNLLIMYLIAKKFLYQPIKNVIAKRQSEVDKVYNEADAALSKANSDKELYEVKLKNAENDAEAIIRDANEKAGALHKQLVDDANYKAALAIREAEEEIAFEKKKAENEIKTQITEVSVILAQKLIEREIKPEDHSDMVADFIDALDDKR